MRSLPVHCEVLPNGLTLLLCETHLAPVAELQIWAKVGSADERPGEAGLAHFHEHMLFKGTERRGVGEVAAEVEGAGGQINAYTSLDVTVYHATLPAAELSLGLEVLADAVLHSVFDPAEIEREIEVVLEEIRRAEDSPSQVLGQAVLAETFRAHPYRAPILGTPDSVTSFDQARVRAFFERWYTPGNFVIAAAGDFDARALAGEATAVFGALPPGGARRKRAPEPAQKGLRSTVLARPFERASAELAWPTVPLPHPDAVPLDLLAWVLGGCDSSRLVLRVKERDRLADRADASSYTPLDPGLSSVSLGTDTGRLLPAVAAAVREVERVRAEPVSRDELERARVNFLASERFERESVGGLAGKLGGFHVTAGDWRAEAAYLEAVKAATPEDLVRVAREYLAPERLTVGAVVPEEADGEITHERIAQAVEAGVRRTARAFAVPAVRAAGGAAGEPETAAGSRTALRPAIHSYTLPCGAALHVVPRRELPVVALRAVFLGGLLAEDERTSGLSRFTSALWMRGTRTHSAAGFARAGEDLAAEIDSFSGRNSLGLTLEAPVEALDGALELFASAVLEPAFDPSEIEHERQDTLAAIERREDRLAQRAFMLFAETLFERHPYRGTILGLADTVAAFDEAAVRTLHARLVMAQGCVIGVAGDVDPDATARRLSSLLADLDDRPVAPPSPPDEPPPHELRTAEFVKDRAQTHVVLGFRGLTLHDDDRFALEVIAQLLGGQGGRLFLDLRDRRSLAYAVSASNLEGVAPGWFATYIATAPDKYEAARAGLDEILRELLEGPPDAGELSRAKRFLVGTHAIELQRNATHAAHVSLAPLYGLGPEADYVYPERIQAVTAEDVLRTARRILDPTRSVLAVVR